MLAELLHPLSRSFGQQLVEGTVPFLLSFPKLGYSRVHLWLKTGCFGSESARVARICLLTGA